MNAGTIVGGRRAEETPETVQAAAEARKQEIEANRQRVATEMGIDPEQAGIDEVLPKPAEPESEPVVQEAASTNKDAEIAELQKDIEIAELKAKLAKLEGKPSEPETPAAPPRARKMPVVTKES